MELGATGFVRQRHGEKAALERYAGKDHPARRLEVLARLLVRIGLAARRQPDQAEGGPRRVTGDAPGVAGALFGQQRLDAGLERVEIERRGRLGQEGEK